MNFPIHQRLRMWLALSGLMSLLFLVPTLSAQVSAPDFLCVSNDTLRWTPATNTCGPFNAYLVFGSNQPAGPYSLLATITNPGQTSFFNASAGSQTWYYYLQSDHTCPGQTRLSSDTLDNRIPLAGPIRRVSVEGGGVIINWDPSPSPETFAYVLNRITSSGNLIVDTIFGANNLSYTDFLANPDDKSESYFVLALDACGNKSLVGEAHNTVFLTTTSPTACQAAIGLNWNAYQGWPQGVARYEVFAAANGGTPTLVGQSTSISFSYDQINDGENVCLYVEAVANGSGLRARSNQTCQTIQITQPIRRIDLLVADVDPSGNVILEWLWNPAATLTSAEANRFRPGNDAAATIGINVTGPLTATNTLTDANPPAGAGFRYLIIGRDGCGNTVNSNSVFTLALSGQAAGDGFNQLSWASYTHDLLSTLSYDLIKINSSGNESIAYTGGAETLNFADPVDVLSAEECCYYLRARVSLTDADGKTYERSIRSNRVCLSQPVRLYVPNVFAPEGINRVFKPQTPTESILSYSLDIYDRWGGQVFRSENIDQGWNGDRKGEPMPQGTYLYHIVLKQTNGQSLETTGTVALIR